MSNLRRRLEKGDAIKQTVPLLFYEVIERKGRKMMKPLDIKTEITFAMVKAISENTIIEAFYERLSLDLRKRGVKEGTLVQLRADFSKCEGAVDSSQKKGTHVLCEVRV